MIALYGTQGRYAPDVLEHGVRRDSAAVFLLPDSPEHAQTLRTLTCAVYHSLGLATLSEAAWLGRSLRAVLENGTGGVCLIWMRGITTGKWPINRYAMPSGITYPYVKLRDSGPIDSPEKFLVLLEPQIFDAKLSEAQGESGCRFFQKLGGEDRRLPGCDMRTLERLCTDGAEQSMRMAAEFLFGKGTNHESS